MYQNCCKKCGSISLHTKNKGNHTGLYCNDCGAWIKWLGQDELRAFEYSTQSSQSNQKASLNNLEQILRDYFNVPNNTYAYNLTRVKTGFSVGTITIDDFKEFDEETIIDLANYIRNHLKEG